MPADGKGVKTMKITQHTQKDGTAVERSSIYFGIDCTTGKKVKTTISARTPKEQSLSTKPLLKK